MDTLNDIVNKTWRNMMLFPIAMSANIISLPYAAVSTALLARKDKVISKAELRVRFLKRYCAGLTVSFIGISLYKHWRSQQFMKTLEEEESKS